MRLFRNSIGLLVSLLFIQGQALFAQNYTLGITQQVRNDTLFLQVGINATSSPFNLGSTLLNLQLTPPGLNIGQAIFLLGPTGYTFGQSPSYAGLTLTTSPGNIALSINPTTSTGSGSQVSNIGVKIADIAIPFTTCPTGGSVKLTANFVNDYAGNNITANATIITPPAIPASLIPATILGQSISTASCPITITANPGAGFSYYWNTGSSAQAIPANTTGLYTTTVTQIKGGCSVSTSKFVNILSPSTVCISVNSSGYPNSLSKPIKLDTIKRCPGAFTLQALYCTGTFSGIVTYNWRRVRYSNGVSNALGGGQTKNVVAIDPLYYYVVTVTETLPNSCSQVASDTVYLEPYTISFTMTLEGTGSNGIPLTGGVGTCPADTIRLDASNTGGITNYVWKYQSLTNASIPGLTASTYKIVAPPSSNEVYYASVISANGCLVTSSIVVTGYTTANYTFQPLVPVNACSNEPVLLSINTNGGINGFNQYGPSQIDSLLWDFGDLASGANNIKGYRTNSAYHSFSAGGSFTVTGSLFKESETTYQNRCTVVQKLIVTVIQKPSVDITVDTVKLCPGNSGTTLFVTGTLGGGSYNYVWKGPPPVNNSVATSVSFAPSVVGNYTIFASITSDAFGCSSKNVDSVKVLNSDYPNVYIFPPIGKDTLCANSTITLTSSTAGIGSFTHVWSSSPNDPFLSPSGKFADIRPAVTTDYSDIVTSLITTCVTTKTKTIYVSDMSLSPITTSNFKPYCFSNSIPVNLQTTVQGNVNSKPYTFIWSASPLGTAGFPPNNTVTSNITTGSISSLPTDSVPNYTFNVQVKDKFNCPFVSPSQPYILDVKPVPIISIGTPSSLGICFGNSKKPSPNATISGGTMPYTGVYWTTTGVSGIVSPSVDIRPDITAMSLGTIIYSMYAEDVNGCKSNTDFLSVTGNPLPIVTLSQTTLIKGCVGTPQSLSIPASNSSGTIVWKEKNSGQVLANNTITYNGVNSTGLFGASVTIAGCADSSFVSTSFLNPPSGTLSITPSVTSPCSYTILKVWASNFLGDSLTYQWSMTGGGGTLLNAQSDTVTYLADSLDSNVNFKYTTNNRCGVATSPNNLVQYLPTPVAILTTSAPETFLNKPMVFTNNSLNTDKPATLFLGNGSVTSSFILNTPLSYQYTTQGDYTVKMKIKNNNGCSDSVSVIIGVIGTKTVFVPNVFNPNANDNDNRTFRVFGTNIISQDFQMTVYNRWGQVVYTSTNFDEANANGWNGSVPSAIQAPGEGVYTYSVKGKFIDGSVFERVGTVTMLR